MRAQMHDHKPPRKPIFATWKSQFVQELTLGTDINALYLMAYT